MVPRVGLVCESFDGGGEVGAMFLAGAEVGVASGRRTEDASRPGRWWLLGKNFLHLCIR